MSIKSACDWAPPTGERLGPLWGRLNHLLDDGAWHPWPEVVAELHAGSDVKLRTVERLIEDAVRHGRMAKQGRRFKTGRDARQLALLAVPIACRCRETRS